MIYHREDRDKRNVRASQWHKNNPERGLWSSAKKRARYENLPFDIVPEDVVIPTSCPVLGIPLIVKAGRRTNNTPSLDKVVKEKGYVKGNIEVISWRANRLKSDGSFDEIEKIYEYMKKYLTKSTNSGNI